jgi:hypothetical protein
MVPGMEARTTTVIDQPYVDGALTEAVDAVIVLGAALLYGVSVLWLWLCTTVLHAPPSDLDREDTRGEAERQRATDRGCLGISPEG